MSLRALPEPNCSTSFRCAAPAFITSIDPTVDGVPPPLSIVEWEKPPYDIVHCQAMAVILAAPQMGRIGDIADYVLGIVSTQQCASTGAGSAGPAGQELPAPTAPPLTPHGMHVQAMNRESVVRHVHALAQQVAEKQAADASSSLNE